MSEIKLSTDTITFGKYKNKTLKTVLKDRSYCRWLVKQDWFQKNYEFLYNTVKDYDPLVYFFKEIPTKEGTKEGKKEGKDFLNSYEYFNLKPVQKVKLDLTEDEKKCYEYYLLTIDKLKQKIINRKNTDNPYDIKAPSRWLKRFEKNYELDRSVFKEFLSSYDLINITYIVERIKKEGGIEYKGAQSFNIAKQRSLKQESYWEDVLKERYGEDLGTQFKFENCIFDFLNISTNTIFECKLGLKDFNEEQHKKYLLTLDKYRIIYIIDYDCVISMEKKEIYTNKVDKYKKYQLNIPLLKNPTYFDELITDFEVVFVEDLSTLFGVKKN